MMRISILGGTLVFVALMGGCGSEAGSSDGACADRLVSQDQTYTAAPATVTFVQGPRLGEGRTLGCSDKPSGGEEREIFAVQGLEPALGVVAVVDGLGPQLYLLETPDSDEQALIDSFLSNETAAD